MADQAASLSKLLEISGIKADSKAAVQMRAYLGLLEKWNRRINLTASTDWPAIKLLFQEAIWASAFYPDNAIDHLDIGSGGGFPAIPLRILRPKMRLELVESRAKRCMFLETIVNELEIHKTAIHNMRLDAFLGGIDNNSSWDCISWKAIKLAESDLEKLRMHAHAGTQFWIFHGKELAVREPEKVSKSFKYLRTEVFECQKNCYLSIYGMK